MVTLLKALLSYVGLFSANFIVTKGVAFRYAKSLANSKGIINLGASGAGTHTKGQSWEIASDPLITANVDIDCDRVPKCDTLNMNFTLPYNNKAFDVAFASHVLEHLDEWELALAEMDRVANYVIVVLPHPLSIGGYMHPGHKQHFGPRDINNMEKQYPNLKVFV